MKFLWSLALFAAAASAQSATDSDAAAPSASSGCDADFIVKRCLETENAKVEECKPTDWDCLCPAYEAVATCFNNCPDDPRAGSAKGQVQINCQNQSLYGTSTRNTKTSSATATASEASATESDDAEETGTATESASAAENTNNASEKARNTVGVLLAVAGVVAAIL
ncbi:phospholipase d1 protein [Fusarium langsethiae]|jgi:hypothetical protein|uniref:Phospholipase d1 protein n=2 Tax=Fusarium sambucinum species complex TaxID=569360 RepID=A0A0M9F199_FUSLA|nr:phospholipase d1 protein [Fusarium langsethiae]RGP74398.1 cfem domain-containing [Fusarium sporotrichioides]GKU01061.1 unnamed protein product [Fusarium langsethiae]GKU13602.1 unnamed protein product [Fusarium langsethiae]